jgi:hypothetical protein
MAVAGQRTVAQSPSPTARSHADWKDGGQTIQVSLTLLLVDLMFAHGEPARSRQQTLLSALRSSASAAPHGLFGGMSAMIDHSKSINA